MPKLRKYILAVLLTSAACAVMAQTPAPHKTDTVYDTVWDTVNDTVQVAPVNADTDDRYYRLAEKAIDHRMTVITVLLTFIGLMLASFSVALVVEGRRAARKIDQELELSRKDVANAILTAKSETLEARNSIKCDLEVLKIETKAELEKVRSETDASVKDIRRLKDEAQQHILDTKEQAKKELDEITEAKKKVFEQAAEIETRIAELTLKTEKPIREAEQKATGTPGINFDEKLKLIESADAEEAIKQYEMLIADMQKEGVPLTKIPSSLRRNIGFSYYGLGRHEEALPELQEYLKESPQDEDALDTLAHSFYILGNYMECIGCLAKLTSLNPDNDRAFFNWGLTCSRMFDKTQETRWLDLAFEKYERSIFLKPNDHAAFHNWGIDLGKMYDATKGIKWLHLGCQKSEQAVTIKPDHHWAFYNWGTMLGKLYDATRETKWLDLAFQKFEQATSIKADFPEAYNNLANVFLRRYHLTHEKKNLEEALEKNSRALELAPERKDYNYNRACALALLGKKDDMLAALKEAIAYDNEYKKMAHEDDDKDFKSYWDDPEFIALTKEDGGEQAG